MKRFRNLAIFLFFSLAIFILIVGSLFNYYLSPVSNDQNVEEIVIVDGKKINNIVSMLYEMDLIRNPKMFKLYLDMRGIKELKEGTFYIRKSMSSRQIVESLVFEQQ